MAGRAGPGSIHTPVRDLRLAGTEHGLTATPAGADTMTRRLLAPARTDQHIQLFLLPQHLQQLQRRLRPGHPRGDADGDRRGGEWCRDHR